MPNARRRMDISKIDRNFSAPGIGDFKMVYTDVKKAPFVIEGLPWFQENRSAYYRIPRNLTAKQTNDGVISLSHHTAGVCVRFRSDSPVITVRAKLAYSSDMNHMPRAGSAGFDSYCTPEGGEQRYNKTVQPNRDQIDIEALLGVNPGKGICDWQINFPLYGGVDTVEIGIVKGCRLEGAAPHKVKDPVLFYGSSITQGGCASRPGMAYTNILSRYYNRPFLNFGFSGSGKGEPEVVRHLASITDPALFLLGYEANAGAAGIRDTLDRTLSILRERHPSTPILVISRLRQNWEIRDSGSPLIRAREAVESVDFQRNLVDRHRQNGDENIYFIDGGTLSGRDREETTVDGCHPTDLGFYRVAEGLIPALDVLLNKERVSE